MPVLVRIDARDALAFTARPEPRSSDHTGEIWYLLRRYLLSRDIGYSVRTPVSTLLEPSIDLSRNVDLVSRRAAGEPAARSTESFLKSRETMLISLDDVSPRRPVLV